MTNQRWLLGALLAALLVTTTAYLLVRDTTSDAEVVDATRESSPPTERTSRGSTTTEAPATTAAHDAVDPESTTVTTAPPTTQKPRTVAPDPVPPPTTSPAPPFAASVVAVSAAELGSSWREGCPLGPDQLRAVDVTHWGYDGAVHTGRVIVAADQADRIVVALRDVYEARFPIERMIPVQHYGSDDHTSMVNNNTSAFNCRPVGGTSTWSEHAYGAAIDINPLVNPYVKNGSVDPPEGAVHADRSRNDPGMIKADDAVVRAFARQGWAWGGYWSSGKDYQHFSASGR